MPWCEPCTRFYNPNSLDADGACPQCGEKLKADEHAQVAAEPAPIKVPWHFWLLLACATVYLGWRLVQGVLWLFG